MGDSRDRIRVLCVGSTSESAATIGRSLERVSETFESEAVVGVDEAAARFESEAVDCVLSEYELPESTGLDLLSRVREEDPDLPFVLFPSNGSEAIASEAISAGVTDYVERTSGRAQYDALAKRLREAVDRSRVERERRRLRSAVESAREGISMLTADGHYRYVNDAYADIYGYEPSELIGKHKDIVYPEGTTFDDILPALREQGEVNREDLGLRSDGDTVPVEYTVSPTDFGDYICVARDVSNRREREAELERQSTMLDSIMEQIPAHLYIKDCEGRHLRVSDYFTERDAVDDSTLQIESYDREHILGKTDREINTSEHSKESYADDMAVIETGDPILNKEEYISDDDEWNLTSKVPWRDEDGTIRGLIGISQRITEQKRNEAELKRQNERLAEFASALSHDLRNPLQTARGRVEVLQQRYDDEQLDVVQRAHDRMVALIDDILTLARSGEETTEERPVDLAAVVDDCRDQIDPERTAVEIDTEQTIIADRSQLRRLVGNLLSNADEHGGEKTVVTIGDLEDGFYVEDDGPGIPPEDRDAVFEAGYSDAEDGTGFGLRIVEQLAQSHGWTVELTEGAEGGARFEIRGVESPRDR